MAVLFVCGGRGGGVPALLFEGHDCLWVRLCLVCFFPFLKIHVPNTGVCVIMHA